MIHTLIGITVSVNYDDYLFYCLTNAQVLDHWYVAINPSDTPTVELLKDIPNVTMVPFDFQKGGHVFNKSGAIHQIQQMVHTKYPEAWILLVDSDIVLPLNLRNVLNEMNETQLDPQFLHGAYRAYYRDYQQLEQDKPSNVEKTGCWGFFHLYYDKSKFCQPHSKDASRYDDAYKALFGHRYNRVLPITVKHLGDGHTNWQGRKTKRFVKN
jgi:hypothetical protein